MRLHYFIWQNPYTQNIGIPSKKNYGQKELPHMQHSFARKIMISFKH